MNDEIFKNDGKEIKEILAIFEIFVFKFCIAEVKLGRKINFKFSGVWDQVEFCRNFWFYGVGAWINL